MESFGDKIRAGFFSLLAHAIVFLVMFIGLAWTNATKPVSVAGPIIEATLVDMSTLSAPRPQPIKPPPPRPKPPTPVPTEAPIAPPVPPRAEDNKNQEEVNRLGQLKAQEEREQEEKRKREQELLEEQERIANIDRERNKQLEDIRKQREQAEQRRKLEEQRMAQLEDRQKQQQAERQAALEGQRREQLLANEQAPGNEGTDNDLRSRYILALQTTVTNNWLRPDTAQRGLKCTLRVVQIPGGQVLSANVIAPCNGDDLTRRSLEAAVLRAQPLPYQGYESVFERSIDFIFRHDG